MIMLISYSWRSWQDLNLLILYIIKVYTYNCTIIDFAENKGFVGPHLFADYVYEYSWHSRQD